MRSWSDLPEAILECFAKKLNSHTDLFHFGCVCASWRSVIKGIQHSFPLQLPLRRCLADQCELPLVLLACKDVTLIGNFKKISTGNFGNFYCVSETKIYGEFSLPECNKKSICGSSKGWLVVADRANSSNIHLLDPFMKAQVQLPSLPLAITRDGIRLPSSEPVWKVILAAGDPTPQRISHDCLIVAIEWSSRRLSFCRLGDQSWTYINRSPYAEDVIFYMQQLYAVDGMGTVYACEMRNHEPTITNFVVGPACQCQCEGGDDERRYAKRYLVESSSGGELIQVLRWVKFEYIGDPEFDYGGDPNSYQTTGFEIFKLMEAGDDFSSLRHLPHNAHKRFQVSIRSTKKKMWVKVESLGDEMLFLGLNHSTSISATTSHPNCKGNCIYFTDDFYGGRNYYGFSRNFEAGCHDIGVYDLDDRSLHPLYPNNLGLYMPPIWFTPSRALRSSHSSRERLLSSCGM